MFHTKSNGELICPNITIRCFNELIFHIVFNDTGKVSILFTESTYNSLTLPSAT